MSLEQKAKTFREVIDTFTGTTKWRLDFKDGNCNLDDENKKLWIRLEDHEKKIKELEGNIEVLKAAANIAIKEMRRFQSRLEQARQHVSNLPNQRRILEGLEELCKSDYWKYNVYGRLNSEVYSELMSRILGIIRCFIYDNEKGFKELLMILEEGKQEEPMKEREK